MHRRDLLGKIWRRGEEGQDDLEKNFDDGMNLKRCPDLDCLSVRRAGLSLCVEKNF